MGVGPFCKIKINKELKLKLKEKCFWYFWCFQELMEKRELIKIKIECKP